MNLHLIEEMEYQASRDDRLWDAGEGVCCGAFQLGACPHTENDEYDEPVPTAKQLKESEVEWCLRQEVRELEATEMVRGLVEQPF